MDSTEREKLLNELESDLSFLSIDLDQKYEEESDYERFDLDAYIEEYARTNSAKATEFDCSGYEKFMASAEEFENWFFDEVKNKISITRTQFDLDIAQPPLMQICAEVHVVSPATASPVSLIQTDSMLEEVAEIALHEECISGIDNESFLDLDPISGLVKDEIKKDGIELSNTDINAEMTNALQELARSQRSEKYPTFEFEQVEDAKIQNVIRNELAAFEAAIEFRNEEDERIRMSFEDFCVQLAFSRRKQYAAMIAMGIEDRDAKFHRAFLIEKMRMDFELKQMTAEDESGRIIAEFVIELEKQKREKRRKQLILEEEMRAELKIKYVSVFRELEMHFEAKVIVAQKKVHAKELIRMKSEISRMEQEEQLSIQFHEYGLAVMEQSAMADEDLHVHQWMEWQKGRAIQCHTARIQLFGQVLYELQEHVRMCSESKFMKVQEEDQLRERYRWEKLLNLGSALSRLFDNLSQKLIMARYSNAWNQWRLYVHYLREECTAAKAVQCAYRGYHIRQKFRNALNVAHVITAAENDLTLFAEINFSELMGGLPEELANDWGMPDISAHLTLASQSFEEKITVEKEIMEYVEGAFAHSESLSAIVGSDLSMSVANLPQSYNTNLSLWQRMKKLNTQNRKDLRRGTEGKKSKTQCISQEKLDNESTAPLIQWSTNGGKKKMKAKIPSLVERLRGKTRAAR